MIKYLSVTILSAAVSLPLFAASGAQISNHSSCHIKFRGNSSSGLSHIVYPDEIKPGASEGFDVTFPSSFFSSFDLYLVYGIHCDDPVDPDGGELYVFNFSEDKKIVGACVFSDELKLYPGWIPQHSVTCGKLMDNDGAGFNLKLKDRAYVD